MIHYAVRCTGGHEFDGWFKSSAAFDAQCATGLIECPVCASTTVTRAMMAPRVGRGIAAPTGNPALISAPGQPSPPPLAAAMSPSPAAATAQAPAAHTSSGGVPVPAPISPTDAARMPDGVRVMLQRLRAEVERNCDYVGPHFAAEARRIHLGKTEARAIYGETTPSEAESLAEDGISCASLPWVPRADG